MKHYKIILCLFLLIFILFILFKLNKEGLTLINTNENLKNNLYTLNNNEMSLIFNGLRNKIDFIDSDHKVSFESVPYTYETASCSCSDVKKNNKNNCIGGIPVTTKKTISGNTSKYNIIKKKNGSMETGQLTQNSFNGFDNLLENIVKEIFNLTMIEANIIWFIKRSRQSVINQEYVQNLYTDSTSEDIKQLHDNIETIYATGADNILKLGAFNITNKSINQIMTDLKNNNYSNVSLYFDTNIQAINTKNNLNQTSNSYTYTSTIGYDNTNNVGTHRQQINNRRNSLIYNLVLLSNLYSQSATASLNKNNNDVGSIYDTLREFIKNSPNKFIDQDL